MPPDNLLPSIAHIQHTTDIVATQAKSNSLSNITISKTAISPSSDTNIQEYDEDQFSEQPQHQQQQQQLSQQDLLHVDQWHLLRDERFSTFNEVEMRVKELARQQGFNVFRLRSEQSAVTPRATFACSYGGKPRPYQRKTNKSDCPWQINLSYNCDTKLWALIDTSRPHLRHSNHTLDVDAAKRKRRLDKDEKTFICEIYERGLNKMQCKRRLQVRFPDREFPDRPISQFLYTLNKAHHSENHVDS
ncbi:hypothetical protein BGZ52_004943 [Haplosporangium bisporale]|nr:hypothetical protein BGZ52_004943 [Haplosporangium bisporale]